jgi:hypothetical protein
MKPFQPGTLFDAIGPIPDGVNSDVPPALLPKTQLAYARNVTMRGGYARNRPPHRKIELTFDSASVQTNFETKLWQGAAYYKPDAGFESLVASIAGRLFKVTPSSTEASVSDITPTVIGNTLTPQAWLWQAENFLLCNDGQTPTAIYDGATSIRASQGEVVATIQSTWSVPSPGDSTAVTFTSTYTGPFNRPLYAFSAGDKLLGTFEVNAESSTSGYLARLTNIDDASGTIHFDGTDIEIINNWSGSAATNGTPTTFNDGTYGTYPVMQQNDTPSENSSNGYRRQTVQLTPQFTGSAGSRLKWPTLNREQVGFVGLETDVISVNPDGSVLIQRDDGPSLNNVGSVLITAGDQAILMNAGADALVAITTDDFTAPEIGDSVDVTVDRLITYTNQIVYIDGARYRISPAPPVSSTDLFLKAIGPIQPKLPVATLSTLRTIPQLPIGRMGAYGMGRNWVCLPDGQSFIASDLVGSSSGSIAYEYRDAVLNVTENNYLAGGGAFRVPASGNQITAMIFTATLDASLGQGPLQVFTNFNVFSCNAPVDRETWQDLQQPILTESLIANGSSSHYGTIISNGDAIFRSIDGIRSLILGRRDFQTRHGNTPISNEVNEILDADNRNLLSYASAIVFDNRILMTATPTQVSQGVYHPNLVVMNLDPSSSLRGSLPDIYDGVWDGLNVLQLVSGRFKGIERAFAFCLNTEDNKIELHEILPSNTGISVDNASDSIEMELHTSAVLRQSPDPTRQLLRLVDGEIVVDDIVGDVSFSAYFRADYDPEWHLWHEWTVGASPKWNPRMGLGVPMNDSDATTNRPYREGYHFQLKLVINGHCTFIGANVQAVTTPTQEFAPPIVNEE